MSFLTTFASTASLAWLRAWVDTFAHPEEWAPLFLVGAGVVGGGFLLLRVIFSGGQQAGPAPLPAKAFGSVVVPVDGREVSVDAFLGEAVPLACALGAGATVRLAYVIEVPRALAVDAPMPEEEEGAARVLASAAEQVRARGLKVETRVQKGRTFADGTLRAIQEADADLLVLAIPASSLGGPDGDGVSTPVHALREGDGDGLGSAAASAESSTVRLELGAYETCQTPLGQILRRAPCEVVFARPSPAAA